jgi:hypothetical protein
MGNGSFPEVPEYRLIENRFQFQSLEPIVLSFLLWGGGNYYQIGAKRSQFRRAGYPERQTPFVVTDPHSQLVLVTLRIVGGYREGNRGYLLRADLNGLSLGTFDEEGLWLVIYKD